MRETLRVLLEGIWIGRTLRDTTILYRLLEISVGEIGVVGILTLPCVHHLGVERLTLSVVLGDDGVDLALGLRRSIRISGCLRGTLILRLRLSGVDHGSERCDCGLESIEHGSEIAHVDIVGVHLGCHLLLLGVGDELVRRSTNSILLQFDEVVDLVNLEVHENILT